MSAIVRRPEWVDELDTFSIFSDFDHYVSADQFTTVASDSGTVAVSDGVNGVVVLTPSDGTVADNDETYLRSTTELFKFAAGKPHYAICKLQFTEANTDDANVAFGFCDAVSANTIVDNGAGLKTSFSGACIYKVDGGTVWRCITSNGTTQTITATAATAGGSSQQTLEIMVVDSGDGADDCVVTFYLDGVILKDATYNLPIRHKLSYASLTEMHVFVGVKNGGTNLETVNVDLLGAAKKR